MAPTQTPHLGPQTQAYAPHFLEKNGEKGGVILLHFHGSLGPFFRAAK